MALSLFYLEKKENKYKLISGLYFSFAVLSYEKFLIIFIFFFISYSFINFKNKQFKNILFLLAGFIIPILIFFFYINIYQIYDDWLKYHSIGSLYIDDNYVIVILNFLKNLIQKSFIKFIFEPYWLFFLILLDKDSK